MKHPTLCTEPYCMNTRRRHRKICSTCDKKKWRAKYVMKACFQTLRQNARRRDKPFTITFEYFKRFCYRTKYIAGKGRTKDHYSIHRIKNELGYVPGNIKSLINTDHQKIHSKVLNYDYRYPNSTNVIQQHIINNHKFTFKTKQRDNREHRKKNPHTPNL